MEARGCPRGYSTTETDGPIEDLKYKEISAYPMLTDRIDGEPGMQGGKTDN